MSTSKYIFIGTNRSHAKRFTWLKVLLISVLVLGVFLYVIDISSLNLAQFKFHLVLVNDEENEPWNWDYVRQQDTKKSDVYKSYFVNEAGCRMPRFNITDTNVDPYIYAIKAVECRKGLTKANNHYIWIDLNETEIYSAYKIDDVDELSCSIEPFTRSTDFANNYTKPKYYFKFGDIVKVNDEFIRVICYNRKKRKIFRDYHYFVGNNKLLQPHNDTTVDTALNEPDQRMNVVVFGLDSISRLNFYRQMSESANVVLDELRAFEMFGYNKVGDNTFPNLIPMLTGLDEDELAAGCRPNKNMTYDRCGFIWDDYKARNYTTAYFEDVASMALFQYLQHGFIEAPTDFYNRPVLVELENNVASHKSGNVHLCLGSRPTFQVLFDHFEKFMSTMAEHPEQRYFSLFWQTSYSHDLLNIPNIVDKEFARLLREMIATKELENTFLVLMSDHGIRWGEFRNTYQGMMEERQPFLYIIPPTSFAAKYPSAMRNLVQNRRKLTTHFDLYETLHDLLHPETLTPSAIKQRSADLLDTDPMPRGISLFLPVPTLRTCYEAAIAPHWCTCHEKAILSTTDARVERVARMMVDTMNQMVRVYSKCQRLYLNSISDANILASNNAIGNVTKNFVDITVRLQTKPGLGEFEATVRVDNVHGLELTGTISRTNLYGNQSQCIDDTKIKLYCFCDSLL